MKEGDANRVRIDALTWVTVSRSHVLRGSVWLEVDEEAGVAAASLTETQARNLAAALLAAAEAD